MAIGARVCAVSCTIDPAVDLGLGTDSELGEFKSMRFLENCRTSMGEGKKLGIWQLNSLHQSTENTYPPLGHQDSVQSRRKR